MRPDHRLLLVGLSGRRQTLPNVVSPRKSDHRPSGIPTPFISPLSGSAGAGHCCDTTIGGTDPYHPSKLKCLLDALPAPMDLPSGVSCYC